MPAAMQQMQQNIGNIANIANLANMIDGFAPMININLSSNGGSTTVHGHGGNYRQHSDGSGTIYQTGHSHQGVNMNGYQMYGPHSYQ